MLEVHSPEIHCWTRILSLPTLDYKSFIGEVIRLDQCVVYYEPGFSWNSQYLSSFAKKAPLTSEQFDCLRNILTNYHV